MENNTIIAICLHTDTYITTPAIPRLDTTHVHAHQRFPDLKRLESLDKPNDTSKAWRLPGAMGRGVCMCAGGRAAGPCARMARL
jgi:hypothetical protein